MTELHLEFRSLKGGCTGSSESRLVKMPHCWKSHFAAQISQRIRCWYLRHSQTVNVQMSLCICAVSCGDPDSFVRGGPTLTSSYLLSDGRDDACFKYIFMP